KEERLKRETFYRNPAGNQSRPEELGQQPEASLARRRVTSTAKRSGYRNRSGDASIGGRCETVEVSQPHVQEVIPMSSKAYRATRVNEVNWEQIARGKEGLGVTLGIDVGKFDLWVVCRWADGRFERPWRVKNPW